MKKFFVILLTVLVSIAVLAGPPPHHHHHGGPGWGRGYGPPPRYWGYGYGYRNDGVRLAADIVGLVGAGLYVLNPPRPVVVAPQPVVQQVVEQPVVIEKEIKYLPIRMPDGRIFYQKVEEEKYVPRSTIRYVYR